MDFHIYKVDPSSSWARTGLRFSPVAGTYTREVPSHSPTPVAAFRPPCAHMHREERAPLLEKLEMELFKKIGEAVTWPHKHIDQTPFYMQLAHFIIES